MWGGLSVCMVGWCFWGCVVSVCGVYNGRRGWRCMCAMGGAYV